MVRVRQDPVSRMLTILAFSVNIYLLTFDLSFDTAFPAFLLLGSVVMYRFMWDDVPSDEEIDVEEVGGIFWFTLVALFSVVVGSIISSPGLYIFIPSSMTQLSTSLGMAPIYVLTLHTSLMAIAEEQFFRGVFIRLFSGWPPGFTIFFVTAIGVLYHIRVYGSSGFALLYVAGAWIGFTWVAIRTGRISPLIIAHIINNVLAVGLLMG